MSEQRAGFGRTPGSTMERMTEREAEVRCRHCGGVIWDMGDYSGWVHAATWTRVCDTSTLEPVAEPPDA